MTTTKQGWLRQQDFQAAAPPRYIIAGRPIYRFHRFFWRYSAWAACRRARQAL